MTLGGISVAAGHIDAVSAVAAAGLAAGRSLPELLPGVAERRRIADVVNHLDTAYAEPVDLDEMAAIAQLSRFHFIRVFRAVMGETPRQYLIAARLRAAADRLLDSAEPVTSVALSVGFNDISHFTTTFRQTFGMAPRQWRSAA